MEMFEYLKNVYNIDPETGAVILVTSVNHYSDLFNRLDPSPIRKRDLSPDLKEFLQETSIEIPLSYDLKIVFKICKDQRDPEREQQIVNAFRIFFAYTLNLRKYEHQRNNRRSFFYILVSLVLIALSIAFRGIVGEEVFATQLLAESFAIGGWVFLWESFSRLFINRDIVIDEIRRYERFIKYRVNFQYENGIECTRIEERNS
jgi:hypothetical protein